MGSASSLHDAVRRSVSASFELVRSDQQWMSLSMEFWAQAAREGIARTIMADSFRQCRDLVGRLLRAAQDAGLVRAELDVEAAAALVIGALDGAAVQWAIDAEGVDLLRLEAAATDLIERFIRQDAAISSTNLPTLQEALAGFLAELSEDDARRDVGE